ncbi:ComEC/Rec2 family competence protein [Actinomyces minihominis]|uniref:ComEC/Rec2 family competence protein n=1 Tax=Actinomyces minihominis TaxID=2002838 RepID=UPI000C07726D|nr:ComEC/Rec2 family competence protein [Actinomyces minihominis]
MDRGTDLRLACLALGSWLGAIIGVATTSWTQVGLVTGVLVVGAVALAGGAHLLHVEGGWIIISLGVLACLAALTVGSLSRQTWEVEATRLTAGEGPQSLVGSVVLDPVVDTGGWGGGWKVNLEGPSQIRVLVSADSTALKDARLVRGTKLKVEGKIKLLDTVQPPLVGFMNATKVTEVEGPPQWARLVAELKSQLALVSQKHAGTAGPLIAGMAIGDDRGLTDETKQAMLTTSLTHLTAVSGSHIAISLAVITILLPGRRALKALVTLVFLTGMVTVVGPQPAVLRAVGMGTLAAGGMVLKRGGQPMGLLFTVTTITVLLNPWSAISLGFALSTIATAGILSVGRVLMGRIKDFTTDLPLSRLIRTVADAIVIAVVAQAVTVPILVLANPWIPTYGVVANLLVAPIVAPMTLLALAAALTCLWLPSVTDVLVSVAAPLARYMEFIALWVSGWPLARLPWPGGIGGAGLAVAATVLLVVLAWLVSRSQVTVRMERWLTR